MFHKIMGNLEKMPAIGDIISYFSPIILIVTLKSAQKSNWGKKYEFFPLRPCNNFSTLTDCVLGGKYSALLIHRSASASEFIRTILRLSLVEVNQAILAWSF